MAASPFQQQARLRKLLYLGLILALFTLALLWRRVDASAFGMPLRGINAQAESLAIREESRGEADLTGAAVRLMVTGSRGLATCFLWDAAQEKQKKNQWNELEILVRSLTKLQPHFISPWLFQSWNLSYNVSVESDRIRDKYFYISRGIELLAQGERQNRDHPDLRWSIGFYTQHKIMQSDETNYHRSLFQLSMIPPNERDPARFWKEGEQDREFNYAEFEKFVEKHPQLVRRLREGMRKHNVREQKQLFDTPTPEAVVRFLEENHGVPSIYRPRRLDTSVPANARRWAPANDELLPPVERFPVLPPPRANPFDRDALTQDSQLPDETDGYAVAHAWFCYAQESLPLPGELPGSSEPISDRTRTRRPRNMTTLIFRAYPAQGRRYMAERLQQEGWFDEDPWDVSDWFQDIPDRNLSGKSVKVGGGRQWSRDAWARAFRAWEKHGLDNRILFRSPSEQQTWTERAENYMRHNPAPQGRPVPPPNLEHLSETERRDFEAARYLYEYHFYRNVSNFAHHYNRAFVEAKPVTITCRKLFDRADRLNLAGESLAALNVYRTPIELPAWEGHRVPRAYGEPDGQGSDRPPNPLEAYRDLVLLKNKDYRRDSHNQEVAADIQIRYLLLYNRQDGLDQKKRLARASAVLPLVAKFTPEAFRPPIVRGPFDGTDDEGVPLLSDENVDAAMERLHLPTRRVPRLPGPPPGARMPGGQMPPGMRSPPPR